MRLRPKPVHVRGRSLGVRFVPRSRAGERRELYAALPPLLLRRHGMRMRPFFARLFERHVDLLRLSSAAAAKWRPVLCAIAVRLRSGAMQLLVHALAVLLKLSVVRF